MDERTEVLGHRGLESMNPTPAGETPSMSRTVAVMQPYAFPYVGYFNLAEASDTFIFYDDVTFIQQGWINRNRILMNGAPHRFTIPLHNGSSNELIMNVTTQSFERFRTKFMRQLEQAYSKSPHLEAGLGYVDRVLSGNCDLIADIAIKSITEFYDLIGEKKEFHRSSLFAPETRGQHRADRLVAMTKKAAGSKYVNPIGGADLYEKPYFFERGVELSFLSPNLLEYRQPRATEFVAGLSIIDAVMNNSTEELRSMISSYEIS